LIVTVPPTVTAALADHALRELPREACGLLVGRRSDDRVVLVRAVEANNVAAEGREDRFTVDPRLLLRLEEELEHTDDELVGVYHSHPSLDPIPSPSDRRNASLWPRFVHGIVGAWPTGHAEVAWWWSDAGGVLSSASSCDPASSSPSKASRAAENRPS